MKIIVNDKQNLLSSRAVESAESRANASFAKFGYNVKTIEITVQDINGPKGGVDKRCQILVRLKKMKDVAVTVQDESLSKAIPNAISRAARSVRRILDRRSIREGGRLAKLGFEI